MTPATRSRPRRSDGERTHAQILEASARLASVEGIHGLTIGGLAAEMGVSKSGLYAHFGSKEALQLETIRHAQAILEREVVQPMMAAPAGRARLEALARAYFSYLERWVFPGGCFFASLLAEADARGGPIGAYVTRFEREWLGELASCARAARRRGEFSRGVDPEQFAFEFDACMEFASYHFTLFRDPAVLRRARRAIEALIERASDGKASRGRTPR